LDDKFLNHNSENKKTNSLPLEFSPPSGERGYNYKEKTIFTYGRWVEGKNLEMIFNTYEELKNKVPNLILKI
jgi:glycosyltransferase involved in cell wall biosynthesis